MKYPWNLEVIVVPIGTVLAPGIVIDDNNCAATDSHLYVTRKNFEILKKELPCAGIQPY